jgi:hypothetical protein
MLFDQLPHLALRELVRVGEKLAGITRQMNHVVPLIIGWLDGGLSV